MVPPSSVKITRVPTYSSHSTRHAISDTGLSPTMAGLSRPFSYDTTRYKCWALPRSLATTKGISVDFFSCRYLDVSVPRVRLPRPMDSVKGYWLAPVGFPIRTSPDQSLVADSPKLFAGSNVLHRLQLPRHPPYALIRLTIYRNNRPGAQPQILFNRCCAATCHHSTSTPDMRSTRNSCVYLTHSLRRSRKLPPPQSRYHTSTLLKNLPGAKPRLQQPAAPRPDARVWTLPYPRHQRTGSCSGLRARYAFAIDTPQPAATAVGGAERDRTADLLRARQALSQLSYSPGTSSGLARTSRARNTDRITHPPLVPLASCTWWVWVDSNHRPHPYQGCALTT